MDLAEVDEAVRRLVLKWRSFGAAEGAALGAQAMVPVMGGAIAITADIAVMQILTTAIATRVCYAYGFDAKSPELQHIVQRMVARSFRKQLRNDHRILAALEKLMKQWGGVSNVPEAGGRPASARPIIVAMSHRTDMPMDYPPHTECPVLVCAVDVMPSSRHEGEIPCHLRALYWW